MTEISKIFVFLTMVSMASLCPAGSRDDASNTRCMSVDEAKTAEISIADMRKAYKAAYKVGDDDCVFPDGESDVATAWTDFQELLYAEIRTEALIDIAGRSVTSVVLFEPDGRIAYYFHSRLAENEGPAFCQAVLKIALDYRFPLTSDTTFSQCGTTHFGQKRSPLDDSR